LGEGWKDVGKTVGFRVGDVEGMLVGAVLGGKDVAMVGANDGDSEGEFVGISVGGIVGRREGAEVLGGVIHAKAACVPSNKIRTKLCMLEPLFICQNIEIKVNIIGLIN